MQYNIKEILKEIEDIEIAHNNLLRAVIKLVEIAHANGLDAVAMQALKDCDITLEIEVK